MLTDGLTNVMVVIVVAAARVSSWKPPPLAPSLVSWVGGSLTLPFCHTTTTSGRPAREAALGRTGQGIQEGQPQQRRRPRSTRTGTELWVMIMAAVPMPVTSLSGITPMVAKAVPMTTMTRRQLTTTDTTMLAPGAGMSMMAGSGAMAVAIGGDSCDEECGGRDDDDVQDRRGDGRHDCDARNDTEGTSGHTSCSDGGADTRMHDGDVSDEGCDGRDECIAGDANGCSYGRIGAD